jgi:cytochrome c oxidase subunit 4
LTIEVATYDFGKLALTIALVIAGVKSFFVMSYFMHLKYESKILIWLVVFVFVLFALLVGITFIDYAYRT